MLVLLSGVLVFGQNTPPSTANAKRPAPLLIYGPVKILSDTKGVDFRPYLEGVIHTVRLAWYPLIPASAHVPLMKKGKVSIRFAILKDGKVAGMQYEETTGDVALDRAAYGAITASNPYSPLPSEFDGEYLAVRFTFYYNPDKDGSTPDPASQSSQASPSK